MINIYTKKYIEIFLSKISCKRSQLSCLWFSIKKYLLHVKSQALLAYEIVMSYYLCCHFDEIISYAKSIQSCKLQKLLKSLTIFQGWVKLIHLTSRYCVMYNALSLRYQGAHSAYASDDMLQLQVDRNFKLH